MSKVARFFVGIDLHLSVVQVCVVDEQGKVVEERRFRGRSSLAEDRLMEYLVRWKDGGRYVVEAIGLNRWFVNRCREDGLEVVVADPSKLNLKLSGKKTDRRDARELARRLWLGDIDQSARTYYPTEEEYGARKVLRTRHDLMKQRQQVVNQIRAILNAYRIAVPGRLTGPRPLERLREVELPTEDLRLVMGQLADLLGGIHGAIQGLEGRIRALGGEEKELCALPQVAEQTAATLALELGDVSRFDRARAVASYAGLVPRVMQSADTRHHGRLTKRGNRELRWVLCQWAVRMLAKDPTVQTWAAPMLKRMSKNKVRVALARRLLMGVYVMRSRGEAFSLERCLGR